MNPQRGAYLDGLGDDWLHRNRDDLGKRPDPLRGLLKHLNVNGINHALEVGCSNGWRLKGLKEDLSCNIYGIDPSKDAIKEAAEDGSGDFWVGTAELLPFPAASMDLVVMGYCLWAMDPRDWLPAVAESDRVLKDGGLLAIIDRYSARPTRKAYPDRNDVFGYAYDWKKLWLGHPAYVEISEAMWTYADTLTVEGAVLMQKNMFGRIMTAVENKSE